MTSGAMSTLATGDGDRNADDGEYGAQFVAEGIPQEDLKDEHCSKRPFPTL